MKIEQAILTAGILIAVFTSECRAGFDGSDDFNANSVDGTKWGPLLTSGTGFLTQTNGRIEYTANNTPSVMDSALLPWKLNFGSYTQNWEVQVDVNVAYQPPGANFQNAGIGLLIFPGTN